MKQGKLIIVEGGDGSGKATQAAKLTERLLAAGHRVRKVEFPQYQSPSSALIKMYLNGEFGADLHAVNPYAASAFYAVDRYASYKTQWEEFLRDGGIVICDRYTTSNMAHQAVKISDPEERDRYLAWLWDLEFVKFGLPVPDMVLLLAMPPAISADLMRDRASKSGSKGPDVHERDGEYLGRCFEAYELLAQRYGWHRVSCVDAAGSLRNIEDIHAEVYAHVQPLLG